MTNIISITRTQILQYFKKNMIFCLAIFVILSCSSGCATAPYKAYSGPDLPRDKVARIIGEIKTGVYPEKITITGVDNKPTADFFHPNIVYVLPGKHNLTIKYKHSNWYASGNLWLVASEGRSYTIKSVIKGYNILLWMEDSETGEAVGGITGSEDEPGKEGIEREQEVERLQSEKQQLEEQKSREADIYSKSYAINVKDQRLSKSEETLRTYEALISERLKELGSAKEHISELENAINVKDQRLSESEETLRTLESDFEQEKKTKDALKTELASKEAMVTELQERVKDIESNILHLEEEVARYQDETKGLEDKLLALKGEKATAERRIGQLKSTYEDLISDLKQQIENQEVTIKAFEEKISVTFVDRILFEFAKATITAEGRMILKRVGDVLKKVEGRKIRVVGHSDNIPILPEHQYKFPSNWELSSARAAAVVREFQKDIGLNPGNLEAVGRSFYEPVASNETPEGRAQNRRVEIIIAPNIE